VVPPKFDWAEPFSDGLSRIQQGELWGYADAGGNIVIEPQYVKSLDFRFGYAAVKHQGHWGFITKMRSPSAMVWGA
jgi:hypothetical protein